MIDLNDDNILFEPPYTKNIAFDHLEEYAQSGMAIEKTGIPCHIQNTERCLQEVTRASKHVTEKFKAGFLAASAKSRELHPKSDSKQDLQYN